MPSSLPPHIKDAFDTAKRQFFDTLKNPQDYDFGQFTSVDAVYDFTDRLQDEQHRTGNMRHLRRIKPYLDNLTQFVGVIDTFSQVKADMICLIWGPIKFLLQISNTLIKSYDKVIDVMGQIGDRLPQFVRYTELFKENDNLKSLLAVFFRDILEFHVTALNFFKAKKWDLFFEAMWPKCANKVNLIMTNIERHTSMITSEVTVASILEARQAHEAAMTKYKQDLQWQQRHDLATLQQIISPKLYDEQLEQFRKIGGPLSGKWLDECDRFSQWRDLTNSSDRLLWVEGIPGAGKTILASSIVQRCQDVANTTTIFGFLTYEDPDVTCVKLFQSLLFQLAFDLPDLRPILLHEVENAPRKAMGSVSFNKSLLAKLLASCGPLFLIVDGVDEISVSERRELLSMILDLTADCIELRVLVSSRSEDDIRRILEPTALSVKVNDRNEEDIETFVDAAATTWLDSSGFSLTTSAEIKKLLRHLPKKSEGMILYVILIFHSLKYLSNLEDIKQELEMLPDGLDQAYGRVLKHITENLPARGRERVKRILSWVAGSLVPLRLSELEDALSIAYGDSDFKDEQRNFFNIVHLCGPIVEVYDGYVRFVHFTAKQYLLGPQSGHYVDVARTHWDISRVCITYLGFEFMRSEDNATIRDRMLSGDYVFLYYATTQWIKHVRLYAQGPTTSNDTDTLGNHLDTFINQVRRPEASAVKEVSRPALQHFATFVPRWIEVCRVLASEEHAWLHELQEANLMDNSISHDDSQIQLILFPSYRYVFRIMQKIICNSDEHRNECDCELLRARYGPNLFKCDRIGCFWHRRGFRSGGDLMKHARDHVRAFKCSEKGCQFHAIGFKSMQDLHKHFNTYHRSSDPPEPVEVTPDALDDEVAEALVERAIIQHDGSIVSAFVHKLAASSQERLFWIALRCSTPEIVKVLLVTGISVQYSLSYSSDDNPISIAIKARNMKVVEFLLETYSLEVLLPKHYGSNDLVGLYIEATKLDAPICLQMFRLIFNNHNTDTGLRPLSLSRLFYKKEEQDAEMFGQIIDFLDSSGLNYSDLRLCLAPLASGSCQIEIAEYILKTRGLPQRGGKRMSALYVACKRTDEKAARFVKLLLDYGEDPNLAWRGSFAKEQEGAKNIQKWLGVTWDELAAPYEEKIRKQEIAQEEEGAREAGDGSFNLDFSSLEASDVLETLTLT